MSVESQRQAFKAFVRVICSYYGADFLNRTPGLSELRALKADFDLKHFLGAWAQWNRDPAHDAPREYLANSERRHWDLYYFTDGIYPEWYIIVRPNHTPLTMKEKATTKAQKGHRKDTERLFGVLQGRFRILRHELHLQSDTELVEIVQTCVILHNMLVSLHISCELDDELEKMGLLLP
eukprot:IDg16814t1